MPALHKGDLYVRVIKADAEKVSGIFDGDFEAGVFAEQRIIFQKLIATAIRYFRTIDKILHSEGFQKESDAGRSLKVAFQSWAEFAASLLEKAEDHKGNCSVILAKKRQVLSLKDMKRQSDRILESWDNRDPSEESASRDAFALSLGDDDLLKAIKSNRPLDRSEELDAKAARALTAMGTDRRTDDEWADDVAREISTYQD